VSAALGLALVTLIAQMESAGRTRVLVLNDCPDGLQGFYAPSRNRIGLCRNNHSSDAAITSTLLHEAVHRLQHCRQPALADQLDAAHSVQVLEEEARKLQRWSDQAPNAAADWLRRQLKEQCTSHALPLGQTPNSVRPWPAPFARFVTANASNGCVTYDVMPQRP